MPGVVEVLRGVCVRRVVTATSVAALHAQAKVDPLSPDLETVFTSLDGARFDWLEIDQVCAGQRQNLSSECADVGWTLGLRGIVDRLGADVTEIGLLVYSGLTIPAVAFCMSRYSTSPLAWSANLPWALSWTGSRRDHGQPPKPLVR